MSMAIGTPVVAYGCLEGVIIDEDCRLGLVRVRVTRVIRWHGWYRVGDEPCFPSACVMPVLGAALLKDDTCDSK